MSKGLRRRAVDALVLALLAGAILFAGWGYAGAIKTEKAYTPTNLIRTGELQPLNLIRLHVVANSDAEADQEVKLVIRDEILAEYGELMASTREIDRAREQLSSRLTEIEALATSKLHELGFKYGARASLTREFFPDRSYTLHDGNQFFLPKGMYEALRIVLGQGKGQNWWCVMYPPLCYFDMVQGARSVTPVLPPLESTGVLLVDESRTQDVPVEVRSLIVDKIREGLRKIRTTVYPKVVSGFREDRVQNLR